MWRLARARGYVRCSAVGLRALLLCLFRLADMLRCVPDLRRLEEGTSLGAPRRLALWLLLQLKWATGAQTPCCRLHIVLLHILSGSATLLLAGYNVPRISVSCAASHGRLASIAVS
jgi:hypothetical protein